MNNLFSNKIISGFYSVKETSASHTYTHSKLIVFNIYKEYIRKNLILNENVNSLQFFFSVTKSSNLAGQNITNKINTYKYFCLRYLPNFVQFHFGRISHVHFSSPKEKTSSISFLGNDGLQHTWHIQHPITFWEDYINVLYVNMNLPTILLHLLILNHR